MYAQRSIDEKHSIYVKDATSFHNLELGIIKHTNGQKIDLDKEPVILFRGRDKLALPMLQFYRQLCVEDGATQYQLDSMDKMIAKFELFAQTSDTMKQPDSTLGK